MEKFKLDLESPIKGVYLSSEMIDLMSIKHLLQLHFKTILECITN